MAYAAPHITSRDGDVYGYDRLEATLTYVAYLDRVSDDPTVPVRALMPPDHAHPEIEKYPELVVQRYVQHRTESPLCWLVDVIFDFPDRAGFNGWTTHYSTGEETVRVYRDLDGQIVGSHAYDAVAPDHPTPYYADTLEGRTKLKRPEGDVRRREGMEILKAASTVVLTRTLRNITARKLRDIGRYEKTVNQTPFLAWDPGELMFRHAEIREELGPADRYGRPREALVYPTELHFSVRLPSEDEPEGWRLLKTVDFFSDDRGNEALVYDESAEPPGIVQTVYRRYPATEFRDILGLLEGGSATMRAIGRGKGT